MRSSLRIFRPHAPSPSRLSLALGLLLAVLGWLAFHGWRDLTPRLGESHWIEQAQAALLAAAVAMLAVGLSPRGGERAALLRTGFLLVWLTALLREVDIDAWGDAPAWVAVEWMVRGAGLCVWTLGLVGLVSGLRMLGRMPGPRTAARPRDTAFLVLSLGGLAACVMGLVLDTRLARGADPVLAQFVEETLELWGAVLACAAAAAGLSWRDRAVRSVAAGTAATALRAPATTASAPVRRCAGT